MYEDIRRKNVNALYQENLHREEYLDPDKSRFLHAFEPYLHPTGTNLEEGFAPTGMTTTDFTVISMDDGFHFYGVAGAIGAFTNWPGQYDYVFHAVTQDLEHWTILGKAFQPHPDHPFESHKIWPPYVFRAEGQYYMVYTALDEQNCQSLGLAFSTDGYQWTRAGNQPILDPGKLDWTLKRPDGKVRHCRDPHVEQIGSTYYLYYSTVCSDGNTAVGLAASENLTEWKDLGPCVKNPDPSSWVMESPLVIPVKQGYLLWCLPFDRVYLSKDPTYFHDALILPVTGLQKIMAPEIISKNDEGQYLIGFYGPLGQRISFGSMDWNGERLHINAITQQDQLAPWGIGL